MAVGTKISRRSALAGGLAMGGCATLRDRKTSQTVWRFDRTDQIGGRPARLEGAPSIIEGRRGPALLFDGTDDAMFLSEHPLAGAAAFTMEAIFRPDGGAHEQRWLHLQEEPPRPGGASGGTRMLFEIRVYGQEWALDTFVKGPGYNQPLLFPEKRHPLGRWTHVAQTCDGSRYRSYVDGVLQGEAEIAFVAQGAGVASVGCRLNRVDYFRGAIQEARFTHRALPPEQFTGL